ncbi:UNVERIFIED_CONTAM: hypothetical protein FKN15_006286 [Acipenser sinensis]
MDSVFGGELGILTAEGLTEEGCGVGWASRPLPGNMYSAPHFALITAYQDIKNRLSGLERENCGLKRRLKLYEIKFPMISDFSDDRNSYCSFETKDTSLLNNSLQQQLNQLQHELQNGKEREEHLEAVIQAYEKIHMERSNLQRDLDQMTTLAEKHVEHIQNLEQMLRQRDSSLQNLNSQLRSKEMQYLQLHTSPVHPRSERSGDLKLTPIPCSVSFQETTAQCDQCDVEWIKKAGDEQVNLALAYTELTEELSRLQSLSSKQTEILRSLSKEQSQPVQRHSPVPQRHSPAPQRRSPVPQRLSPDVHRRSPLSDSNDGPASYTGRPTSHHLRASFQGRRSYSEVSDPAAYQRPPRLQLDPASTLPKPRPYREGYQKQGQGLSSSVTSSPRHTRDPFTPQELLHLRFDKTARPPQQSSEDEEEWAAATPPGSLGAGSIRGEASCSAFPIPKTFPPPSSALRCPPPGYQHTEHAQSWPSINLWMETEDCDIRSCPLCQLSFPIGYPDDALIKHIDTHLENSKI